MMILDKNSYYSDAIANLYRVSFFLAQCTRELALDLPITKIKKE